jgi:hypothetical protein
MTNFKVAFPCPESVEIVTQFQMGLITETEMYRKQIDFGTRSGLLTAEQAEKLNAEIFVYGVAAGKYDDGEESCSYCDDFASLRDAIVAWEEYNSAPWCRIEHTVDSFVYALDPMKIRKARKVKMDDGETRLIYDFCHPDGQFKSQTFGQR